MFENLFNIILAVLFSIAIFGTFALSIVYIAHALSKDSDRIYIPRV